uniref:Endoplasmic reticulum transmembrane protein n=1 Tax=Tetraselmis chuii TaxID=63592 RepID=A0A7S1X8W0_9CHLO|mmetsp:Transcript_39967/g.71731  ORF Transcript_39967/g.71731 Transcript_39967/m.71731 type:complete len:247 (+) Transcript_39967:186-926(+)|eukprot:CAMPEP_0177778880 /NCGR_PEP_ID=MMETSP0491_2-20121128/16219_1 /TAXON_ID=63592 /ORGANISM="Tetraselmis chuii, Strain PLY429" /LENGTH=246 /DNA_ID=CAMNT_0019298241 /DNA_START=186 /DNA_END=926 /DNA_ORIENTATION=-
MAYDSLLSVLVGTEALLALSLAAHVFNPLLSAPALVACRVVGGNATGKVVVGTLAAVLLLLFAASVNDIRTLTAATAQLPDNSSSENSLYHSDRIARAEVQALLTFICAILIPLLGALSGVITKYEKLKLSEQAMLKQVKGLQQEYTRVTSAPKGSSGGDGKEGGDGAAEEKLRARVNELRAQLDVAADALEVSEKARKTAEANTSAMKQQAQALEREYDRLMALKDELEAQLARVQASGGSKKDS